MFGGHLRRICAGLVAVAAAACSVQVAAPPDPAIVQRATALYETLIVFELSMRRLAGTREGDPRSAANRARFDGWRASVQTMEAIAADLDPGVVNCGAFLARVGGRLPASSADAVREASAAAGAAGAGSDCQTLGIVRLGQRLDQMLALNDRLCRVPGLAEADLAAPPRPRAAAPARLPECEAVWSVEPGSGGRHGLAVDPVLRAIRAVLTVQDAKRPSGRA